MNNLQLETYLNDLLAVRQFKDYCPNGLQVEGRSEIRKIITGVTASQALLEQALARQADAILVHHGYFWNGEAPAVRGIKKRRLQTLLKHDMNLFAYHLPLDAHLQLGNNVLLAAELGIANAAVLEPGNPGCFIWRGELTTPCTGLAWAARLAQVLSREPLHCGEQAPAQIRTIAWCSGGGQDLIQEAAAAGVDAFFSGEISERTVHLARELGIHYFAAGHHATERYGVRALGEHLATQFGLDVEFIDIPNPV